MKFIVFTLLAICAFSVQGNKLETTIDNELLLLNDTKGIQDIIEAFIEFVKNVINATIKKVEQIVQNIQQIIKNIVEQAVEQVEKIRETIEKILEEIAQQNQIARECVEEQRSRVNAVIDGVHQGLQYCAANSLQQVQDLQNEVNKNVESIEQQIVKLQNIVKDCLNESKRPRGVIGCIIGQAQEIKQNIFKAISDINEAINLIVSTIPEISAQARDCSIQVVSNASPQLQQIVADINQCIKDKNEGNLLLN